MRLELGSDVGCSGEESFAKLADVVIDPATKRVTHLVVQPDREEWWLARLVPVELAERTADGTVTLRATAREIQAFPPVHEVAYVRFGEFPVDDPDWDIGVQEVLALPYYPHYDLQPEAIDYALRYDRVPKGDVEIRRESAVESADGHLLGDVAGFLVDEGRITHLVLEQGHLWERRDVAIPLASIARVETDAVTLSLMRDEVEALPPVEHGRRRH